MKKISLIIMLLMALSMTATAQNKKMKIAVMDFKAGVGVNANEVEGLSDMLINTLFETKKFDIVERSQLYEVIKEQKLQGELTVQQCVQVGRILGVESVLIGTVNFLAEHKNYDGSVTGEYNVDIRAVDVESGQVMATAAGTKSQGSTYRSMMVEIAQELAKKIGRETPPYGLLTKSESKDIYGKYVYFMDDKKLTDDEYMNFINNCPESKWYYDKGCRQRRTGRILAIWVPVGCIVAGATVGLATEGGGFGGIGAGALIGSWAGAASALTSIPFFISGKHKKENAYQVYNEYCAKPAASLSFGPATQGIGMGVYLNF